MKLKKIFLLLILTLLFVGLSFATEVSNDTTSTTDTSTVDTSTTKEVVVPSNTPIKEADNTLTDERNTKEISKQNNNKTVKTGSKTINVNDFDKLYNALTNDTYDTLTLNIKSDITLENDTEINEAIKTLTINGNGKTIYGDYHCQFLVIKSDSKVIIKNIKIINCYSHSKGGAIYNNRGNLTITNSKLINNKAKYGGAISNYDGTLTITNSTLNNNNARSYGGSIHNQGTVTITNSTLNNNNAKYGGAIYNSDNLIIINSILNNNKAKNEGGAISNYDGNNIIIKNNTFKNNKAFYGSAISSGYEDYNGIYHGYNGLIDKNTFITNKANQTGSAIINKGINTTMENNINPDTTNDSSTIYINGINTSITNNIFDDGRINTKITINQIANTQYTDNATITGTFKTTTGTLLKSLTLTVSINDKKIGTTKTDANGTFSYKYKTNTPGTNNITITYAGNTKYATARTKTTFTVLTKPTKITINKIANTQYTDTTTITGTFKSTNGKSLPAILTITINGKNYSTKSDTNGTFTLKYKTNTVGTNNITVSYAGNTKYEATTTKTTFQVTQKPTTITINEIPNTQYTDTTTITGTFQNTNGKPLPATLTITINNKKYTTKTDTNGTFTFRYKTNTLGTNNLTVAYAGNRKYNSTTAKTTFTVQKQNTIITLGSTKKVPVNKQMSIYEKLTDKNGENLANQPITIKIDGKTYNTNTTTYGNYNIKITPTTTGSKTITVNYKGTNNYQSSTATSTFMVV